MSPMKQNVKIYSAGARKVLDRFAEQKKKSVMALCLVTVMAFMWVRGSGVIKRSVPVSSSHKPPMLRYQAPISRKYSFDNEQAFG